MTTSTTSPDSAFKFDWDALAPSTAVASSASETAAAVGWSALVSTTAVLPSTATTAVDWRLYDLASMMAVPTCLVEGLDSPGTILFGPQAERPLPEHGPLPFSPSQPGCIAPLPDTEGETGAGPLFGPFGPSTAQAAASVTEEDSIPAAAAASSVVALPGGAALHCVEGSGSAVGTQAVIGRFVRLLSLTEGYGIVIGKEGAELYKVRLSLMTDLSPVHGHPHTPLTAIIANPPHRAFRLTQSESHSCSAGHRDHTPLPPNVQVRLLPHPHIPSHTPPQVQVRLLPPGSSEDASEEEQCVPISGFQLLSSDQVCMHGSAAPFLWALSFREPFPRTALLPFTGGCRCHLAVLGIALGVCAAGQLFPCKRGGSRQHKGVCMRKVGGFS